MRFGRAAGRDTYAITAQGTGAPERQMDVPGRPDINKVLQQPRQLVSRRHLRLLCSLVLVSNVTTSEQERATDSSTSNKSSSSPATK